MTHKYTYNKQQIKNKDMRNSSYGTNNGTCKWQMKFCDIYNVPAYRVGSYICIVICSQHFQNCIYSSQIALSFQLLGTIVLELY